MKNNAQLRPWTRALVGNGSLPRPVTALAMEQLEEWVGGRRYLDMELLQEVSSPPAMFVAEAA